jgi:heptosyltransferase-2
MAINSGDATRRARVLCLAPSWLGDAVLARPALAWLAAQGFALELWVRDGVARVLEDLPHVVAVHRTSSGSRLRRLQDAWRLRGRGYAAALVLPPSFAAALAARLSGAPLRIGFATQGRERLLNRKLPLPSRDEHLATQYARLAHALAAADTPFTLAAPVAMPPLAVTAAEREAAAAILAHAGAGARPFVVVAPGARYGPAKQYPAERFAAAAAYVAERLDAAVVLVGAAEDAAATRAVQAALPQAIDLAGRTPLGALLGVLASCRGVLANDSGTMHVAAALGRPVVGVFGSTHPAWTAPVGARAGFVVEPVWCAPCFAPTCVQDFACMLGITPERLAAALFERLEGTAAPGSLPPTRV